MLLQSLLLPKAKYTEKFYFTRKLPIKATPGYKEGFKIKHIQVLLSCASRKYVGFEMFLVLRTWILGFLGIKKD